MACRLSTERRRDHLQWITLPGSDPSSRRDPGWAVARAERHAEPSWHSRRCPGVDRSAAWRLGGRNGPNSAQYGLPSLGVARHIVRSRSKQDPSQIVHDLVDSRDAERHPLVRPCDQEDPLPCNVAPTSTDTPGMWPTQRSDDLLDRISRRGATADEQLIALLAAYRRECIAGAPPRLPLTHRQSARRWWRHLLSAYLGG